MTLYTDISVECCARLGSRVETGDLPPGDVLLADARDLRAEHLRGYRHVHLFAGIGGFPLGLAWAACLASLLELPLDAVPNFCADQTRDWLMATNAWLAPRGLGVVLVPLDPATPMPVMPSALCIISGKSPRGGYMHAVVGRTESYADRTIYYTVHDPHPEDKGVDPIKDVAFLVMLDPAPAHPQEPT